MAVSSFPLRQRQVERKGDADRLGMALEYFASKKYHECMLILQDLDKKYKLNPRYKAYLGVSCYYEWEYKDAVKYLDDALPLLVTFAPHERSFYYWASAESHFCLGQYREAIPLYQEMLKLCYENEKADAYYRLGFCRLFAEDWVGAWNYLLRAKEAYRNCPSKTGGQARMAQIQNMLNGLQPKVVTMVVEDIKKGLLGK